MNNICKCGNNAGWIEQSCYECRQKEDRIVFAIMIGIFLVVLGIIFGIKLLWANIVFDDWRCALSECRLIK